MKQTFLVDRRSPSWMAVAARVQAAINTASLGYPVMVTLTETKRTLDQNSRLWAMLADVSSQVDWLVDGELRKITPEDWKAIFTAALHGHNRMARGLDGGVVMLGTSTSRMTVKAMKDLQDLISAFGDEREVKWSDYAEDGW